jgi:hypothetical protein
MNTRVIASCRVAASVIVAAALSSGPASGQGVSKSADLAKELTRLLDQAKLDSIAAKDPGAPDRFVAALYFPENELLVVSAKYTVPVLLNEKLTAKNYKDIYIELNSASVPESKVFIEDLMADGLRSKREANQPFDTYDSRALKVSFDSDWKKQKLSEDDYMKHFGTCDEAYAKILSALLAELKKSSS